MLLEKGHHRIFRVSSKEFENTFFTRFFFFFLTRFLLHDEDD